MNRFRRWGAVALAASAVLAMAVAAPAAASAAAKPDRFIVAFKDGATSAGKSAIAQQGGEVARELAAQNAVAAYLTPGAASALAADRSVAYVEKDAKRYPLAAPMAKPVGEQVPYGVALVQADQLDPADPDNRRIGIIDSGLWTGHEDFDAGLISGADIPGTGSWSEDVCGHGTHVAGTIGAEDNRVGVVGVDPGVQLFITKVFGDDCVWAYASDLAAAVNANLAGDVDVISMSLGGDQRSRTEERALAAAYADGVLIVAAAGNDGNKRTSYPAGYDSVMSVAAVDDTSTVASFSQQNRSVEIAAPGVGVLSTVPFTSVATVSVGSATWSGYAMEGSAETGGLSGQLVSGGLCDVPGSWTGAVVLCERGSITFGAKIDNVAAGGGIAAIVYNNVAGEFSGTLGEDKTIPAISVSDTQGAELTAVVGSSATVVVDVQTPDSGYEPWNGTSMATPHVSGVAAKVWSYNTAWTNVQIREALVATAKDLGAPGRDTAYGYGLVQARAALEYLQATYGG